MPNGPQNQFAYGEYSLAPLAHWITARIDA